MLEGDGCLPPRWSWNVTTGLENENNPSTVAVDEDLTIPAQIALHQEPTTTLLDTVTRVHRPITCVIAVPQCTPL